MDQTRKYVSIQEICTTLLKNLKPDLHKSRIQNAICKPRHDSVSSSYWHFWLAVTSTIKSWSKDQIGKIESFIHDDICGPIRILSNGRLIYFITLSMIV